MCYLRVEEDRRSSNFPLHLTQQTTTRDFTCSVCEFTSTTGSIHVFPYVNSPDSVNKFDVSTHVCMSTHQICSQYPLTVKSLVFHVMTCTSETVPVLTKYDSCQTHSKLVTTGSNTCIHVNTHENTYWWSGIRYQL